MRILISNTPLMYRESLALAVHRHNPDFEVMITDPESLNGEAERFEPHALVRDDEGVETGAPDGVVCWIGIIIDDHLKARVNEVQDFLVDRERRGRPARGPDAWDRTRRDDFARLQFRGGSSALLAALRARLRLARRGE